MKEKNFDFILDKAGTKNEQQVSAISPKEILDEHTEELIAENDRLDARMTELKKKFGIYGLVVQKEFVDDETFGMFVEKWLRRVRKETDYLKPLDALGIRIFCEDLENQPSFPGIDIQFDVKSIRQENIKKLAGIGGLAKWREKKLEVVISKPLLREQVYNFMVDGKLDFASAAVIHELIHHEHFNRNKDVTFVATEVQAHFSGLFYYGNDFSPTDIVDVLTKEEASYNFDKVLVKKVIRAVVVLYGLGVDYNTVASLIADSTWDNKTNRYDPIESVAEERLKELGLDALDEKGLDYLYRLHAENQQLKARIALYELIDEVFTLDTLKGAKIETAGQKIMMPIQFDEDGKPMKDFPPIYQSCITPVSEEFPYDGDKIKTGVIFGPVPHGKEVTFRIGRFQNNEGEEPGATWARNDFEVNYLLDTIKSQSSKINFEEKRVFFFNYARLADLGRIDENFVKVFNVLVTQEEDRAALFRTYIQAMEESYRLALESIEESRANRPGWSLDKNNEKRIEVYGAWVSAYENLKEVFGPTFKKAAGESDDVVERLKYLLSFKDKIDTSLYN